MGMMFPHKMIQNTSWFKALLASARKRTRSSPKCSSHMQKRVVSVHFEIAALVEDTEALALWGLDRCSFASNGTR